MDMSPHTSLEENTGFSEVSDIIKDVLFQQHAGLKVEELCEILAHTHQINLENLRKELGFGNIVSLLAQLPGYRLLHPELHGNCVITHAPKSECTDPFYNDQRYKKQCWFDDSFSDSFLSSTSPPELHQVSLEKPKSPHCKAPTTTEIGCTAVQPEATVTSTQHSGYQDDPEGISPVRSTPDTTSSPDQSCSISPVDTERGNTAMQSLQPKRKSSGINEKILSVLTQSMFASGIRLFKLVEILNVEVGIDLEELCWGMGYKHPLALLHHVPNVRLIDPSRGQDCVVKFQPGIDEEVLSVLTQPMFASGIRLFKLAEILNVELGIDLEEQCWRLGYKHPLDLLRNVPNIKLLDQSKGEECVVKFQPGFKRNERNFHLHKMALSPATIPGQQLKSELKDLPHNYTSHDFLYPENPRSFTMQLPNSSQNGTNNISKHLPKVGPPYPFENKSKGASVTVYASKYHQNFGQPQQKVKPGSTMVFHASKTSVFMGPTNSYTTKTCATKSTFYMPYQNMDPFSQTAYPSQQHSTINPKEQRAFQPLTSDESLVRSQGHSSSLTQHADSPFFQPPAEDKKIDPVLKDEILVVLLQQPQGVAFGEFAGLFQRTHGYQLKISHHGYMSLRALLDAMADLVTISTGPHDLLVKCRGRHHYVFIGGGPFSSRI